MQKPPDLLQTPDNLDETRGKRVQIVLFQPAYDGEKHDRFCDLRLCDLCPGSQNYSRSSARAGAVDGVVTKAVDGVVSKYDSWLGDESAVVRVLDRR